MGIQTKEALIAEIERFKTESLKTHIVKVWAESYANTNPFDYVILEKENNKVWWMKTQAYQLWQMWQAAKAQAVPKGISDIQSWIAVNSFSALDVAHENQPIIDANELAKYIDSLNLNVSVPEGFVLIDNPELESLKSDNEHFTKSCIDWTERAYKQRAKVELIKNEVERFKQSGTHLDLSRFLDNLIEFSTFKHDAEFEGFVLVPKVKLT
jgi:hypothetical protein